MIINKTLSPVPFYANKKYWHSNKWYVYGQKCPIPMLANQTLPFQVNISSTSLSLSQFNIRRVEDNSVARAVNVEGNYNLISQDSYSIVQIKSCSIEDLPLGLYYYELVLSDGTSLISDIISIIDNISNYLRIVYKNNENLYFSNGHIDFSNDFAFELFVRSTIGKPEYEYEEELTKRLGYKFVESQISNKVYKFTFPATEALCDAYRLVRICDYIRIESFNADFSEFQHFNVLYFTSSVDWEDNGDIATVETSFETDSIVQKLQDYSRTQIVNFYNALLSNSDEALKFDDATIAQYYNDYIESINGKMIRELDFASDISDDTVIAIDENQGLGPAKKLRLKETLKTNFEKFLANIKNLIIKGSITTTKIIIGDGTIEWDPENKGFKVTGGLWTDSYLSTKGANPNIGGNEGGATTLGGLRNVAADADRTYDVAKMLVLEAKSNLWTLKNLSDLVGGLDEAELEQYLTNNEYAKKSDIPSLSGYATEQWVLGKGYATTSDLDSRIDALVNGAPAAYDTLKEIADVLAGNVNSISDILTALGNKADKATTLSGYGITDAYTITQIDNILNGLSRNISTLQGHFTDGIANSALRLSDNGSYTAWGQTFFTNGKPKSVSGALTDVTSITSTSIANIGGMVYSRAFYTVGRNHASFMFDKAGGNLTGIGANDVIDTIYFGACDVNGDWIDNYSQIWHFNGTVKANKIVIGNGTIEWDDTNKGFKIVGGLYTESYLSAKGANTNGGNSSTGGLIESLWKVGDLGKTFNTNANDTFNAYAINAIHNRVSVLEGKATNVSFTQSLTSGTQIGTITIDGASKNIYAPTIPTNLSQFTDDVVSGKYLPLSGGTITGHIVINYTPALSVLRTNGGVPYIRFGKDINTSYGELGVNSGGEAVLYSYINSSSAYNKWVTLYHSGNTSTIKTDLGLGTFAYKSSLAFADLTNKPTTLGGYGITDWSVKYGDYDVNGRYDAGYYMITNGSNVPTHASYGSLLVMPYRKASGNTIPDYATQIFLPNGDDSDYPNDMFFRTSLGSSWNAWQRVLTDNNYTNYTYSKSTIDTKLSGYLPLSGGIVDGTIELRAALSTSDSWLYFSDKSSSERYAIGIRRPTNTYGLQYMMNGKYYFVLHEGNYTDYTYSKSTIDTKLGSYLPLSGGTLTGRLLVTYSPTSPSEGMIAIESSSASKYPTIRFDGNISWGYLGFSAANTPTYFDNSFRPYALIHNGNIGSQSVLSAEKLVDASGAELVTTNERTLYVGGGTYTSRDTHILGSGVRLRYGASASVGLILNSSGNVGIGTTSPSYLLHVNGTMYGDLKMKTPRAIWGQSFDGTGNVSGALSGVSQIFFNSQNTHGIIRGNLYSSSLTEKDLVFNSPIVYFAGNVGIGTTSPATKLDVNGNILIPNYYALMSRKTDNTPINLIYCGNDDVIKIGGALPIKLQGNTTITGTLNMNGAAMGLGGSIDFQFSDEINRYGGNLYLQHRGDGSQSGTGGSATGNVVMCKNGGNVLIGTSTDSGYKLDVSGNAYFNSYVAIANNNGLYFKDNSGTIRSQLYIDQYNNTSIGYGAAQTGGNTSIYGTDIVFCSSADRTERVRILSNGNVLIGTSTDNGYKLDIDGTLRASGVIEAGTAIRMQNAKYIYGRISDGTTHNILGLNASSVCLINYGANDHPSNAWIYGKDIRLVNVGGNNEGTLAFVDGKMGIGTSAPEYTADIRGTLHASGAVSLDSVLAVGGAARIDGNVAIGNGSDGNKLYVYGIIRSDAYKAIGNNSAAFVFDKPGTHVTGIGANGVADTIYFGACNTSGAWVTDYYQKWHFNGTIYGKVGIWSDGYVSAKGQNTSSDMRLKNVLNEVVLSVKAIANAPSVRFAWKNGGGVDVGSSAQYWQGVLPDAVKGRDELEMQYGNIALLSAIAIAKRSESHEERIKRLEKENKELRNEINMMKGCIYE